MDLSPECDMNLKGLTKKVSQIPRRHSTHTRMGVVSPRNFKATLKYQFSFIETQKYLLFLYYCILRNPCMNMIDHAIMQIKVRIAF